MNEFERLQQERRKVLKNLEDNVDNHIKIDIEEQLNENSQDTYSNFRQHQDSVRASYVRELKQKENYRKILFYFVIGLLAIFIVGVFLLYRYLLVVREYIPSDVVLTGLSVTLAVNIIGLMSIVFKYVFSDTKDTSRYLEELQENSD